MDTLPASLPAAHKEIKKLRADLAAALLRTNGVKSGDTVDRYTPMVAAELAALVTKRGGDVADIVTGYHSRQRAIKMREWLRENGPKKRDAEPAPVTKKTKPKAKAVEPAPVTRKVKAKIVEPAPVVKKKKAKVVEAPAPVKRKAKVVEAPPAKKKKPRIV